MISAEYAAGLFDGEGCVTFYRSRTYVNVVLTIALTHRPVLALCAERWGGNIHLIKAPSIRPSSQKMYHWRLFGENAERFAYDILPYLQVKKAELQCVLPVVNLRGHVDMKRAAKERLAQIRTVRRSQEAYA